MNNKNIPAPDAPEKVGGAVMIADRIYNDVKAYLASTTGGSIGFFFAQAAKEKMARITAAASEGDKKD